jgi:hypothetical protein
LIQCAEAAENVEISTPVEIVRQDASTIHLAQSPAPVAQLSFPQVFEDGARTNATSASQMPVVLNAKAIRVPDHRGWNRSHTF